MAPVALTLRTLETAPQSILSPVAQPLRAFSRPATRPANPAGERLRSDPDRSEHTFGRTRVRRTGVRLRVSTFSIFFQISRKSRFKATQKTGEFKASQKTGANGEASQPCADVRGVSFARQRAQNRSQRDYEGLRVEAVFIHRQQG